ncbi:MAG TPA: site-2 protease family protein [Longimicrobiales bacterium]
MRGFRLGSIFGIEIRIDYSWFVIFALILWTFTTNVFPLSLPGQTTAVYIVMGITGTLLFFASLLAHELSHSLVARSRGIPVHGITLFIFGGMARTGEEFETPRDEFLITAVGPLSSLIIAALFWVLAWAGAQLGLAAPVIAVASYLAVINLILALFNLLPGFPLDGGRLFRALIWKRTGDLRRATRIASNGGKIFGYVLMVLGLLNMFGGNPLGGIWLVFIGWFVRMAAESSYVQHVLRSSFEGVTARQAMTPNPETVPPAQTLQRFLEEHVLNGRHHSYAVVDAARPIGLITLDRVRAMPKDEWSTRTVGDAMVPISDAITIGPDDSMSRAMEKMSESRLGRVLVTDGDRLLGIISQADVARWIERARLRAEIGGEAAGA